MRGWRRAAPSQPTQKKFARDFFSTYLWPWQGHGRSPLLALAALALAIAFPWSCSPTPGRPAVVSGKTVFEKAAVEGASIEVQVWEDGGWKHHSSSRSGYHGTFRLELPAGRYRILAQALLPGPAGRPLEGSSPDLTVEAGRRRDQLLVPLSPKR